MDNPNPLPTFAPVDENEAFAGNPLDPARIEEFTSDVVRGGERLVQKVSADLNEINVRRAMQIGYMLACQDNNLPIPEMEDPAIAMGYGNV